MSVCVWSHPGHESLVSCSQRADAHHMHVSIHCLLSHLLRGLQGRGEEEGVTEGTDVMRTHSMHAQKSQT